MNIKALAGKISEQAWKHKGLVLRGIKLHPVAKMILQAKGITPTETTKIAGDILANAIAEMSDEVPSQPEYWIALPVIEKMLEEIVDKTNVSNKEMTDILQNLAILFQNRQ